MLEDNKKLVLEGEIATILDAGGGTVDAIPTRLTKSIR